MAWITVDVGLADHPKMAALPTDAARYGWLVTLCKAKLQKRPGVFASDRHYKEVVGRFGKFLPDYMAARLLERHEDGALAVHDWERHQWSIRQARHREQGMTPALSERDASVTDIDRDIDRDRDIRPNGRISPARANGKAIEDPKPWVTLTPEEQAERNRQEKDEAIRRTIEQLGLKAEPVA